MEGVRGEPWVCEPGIDPKTGEKAGPYEALSFASLVESFYSALDEDGENPNLRLTLNKGLGVPNSSQPGTARCVEILGAPPQQIPSRILHIFRGSFGCGPRCVSMSSVAFLIGKVWKIDSYVVLIPLFVYMSCWLPDMTAPYWCTTS